MTFNKIFGIANENETFLWDILLKWWKGKDIVKKYLYLILHVAMTIVQVIPKIFITDYQVPK